MMSKSQAVLPRKKQLARYATLMLCLLLTCGCNSNNEQTANDRKESPLNPTIFQIVPLKGAGPIQFDMSQSQVRALFTSSPQSFTRDDTMIDGFYSNAVQINYDREMTVEFIEFARTEDVKVLLNEIDLLHTDASSVIESVSKIAPYDPDGFELGFSYEFPELELRFWRPDDEAPRFTSVGVGRKGYSD